MWQHLLILLIFLVFLFFLVALFLSLSLSYRVSKSNTLNPSRPFRQLYEGVEESRQKQRSAPVVDISVTMMEG
jgi:preprotein translocase subunit SecG